MKYTVTIKDNESGEIIHEAECNSLIGGASLNDDTAIVIGITNCNGAELLGACKAAKKAIYQVIENEPAAKILFALYEMELLTAMSGKEQGEEDTEND